MLEGGDSGLAWRQVRRRPSRWPRVVEHEFVEFLKRLPRKRGSISLVHLAKFVHETCEIPIRRQALERGIDEGRPIREVRIQKSSKPHPILDQQWNRLVTDPLDLLTTPPGTRTGDHRRRDRLNDCLNAPVAHDDHHCSNNRCNEPGQKLAPRNLEIAGERHQPRVNATGPGSRRGCRDDGFARAMMQAHIRCGSGSDEEVMTYGAELAALEPDRQPRDVFRETIQASRQLNFLLDRQFKPEDVYGRLELAATLHRRGIDRGRGGSDLRTWRFPLGSRTRATMAAHGYLTATATHSMAAPRGARPDSPCASPVTGWGRGSTWNPLDRGPAPRAATPSRTIPTTPSRPSARRR